MAHTDSIPPEALLRIARQVGGRIGSLVDPERLSGVEVELAETFQLWMLGVEHARPGTGGDDIIAAARPTGRWHHQIKFDGRAAAFARSAEPDEGSEEWRLCELFLSPLAESIEAGIERLGRVEVGDDPVVRLLAAPAYQVHALWLLDEAERTSRVLVIDRPRGFSDLRVGQAFDSRGFLKVLDSQPPAVGIYLS